MTKKLTRRIARAANAAEHARTRRLLRQLAAKHPQTITDVDHDSGEVSFSGIDKRTQLQRLALPVIDV